jgi:hypothetical protein
MSSFLGLAYGAGCWKSVGWSGALGEQPIHDECHFPT